MCFGTPSDEHKEMYTRVLQGHIDLAMVRWPLDRELTGSDLDCLARRWLWNAETDYLHGTGHGVGYYLGVHEGPQSISHRSRKVALTPSMVLTNEPGFYKEDEYGIRIENM
jgi:Xaa-Pro aminopeptidase